MTGDRWRAHPREASGAGGVPGDRSSKARQATERIISVGDYNAFQFNDGLVDVIGTVKGQPAPADQVALASADLVSPDLTNLADSLRRRGQYSFVFDGNAQALDHAVVNSSAFERFSRIAYARSNTDFPESLRGDPTRPERSRITTRSLPTSRSRVRRP